MRYIVRLLMVGTLGVLGWQVKTAHAGPADAGSPVLVELFTSEGCSSCPPADALLQRLDSDRVIVLSEHVDYWDQAGWRDPFSSSLYSERQAVYGRRFQLASVYTPQMVVDGETQFSGGDANQAESVIAKAAQEKKVAVKVSSLTVSNGAVDARIEAGALPEGSKGADLYVAVALDHAESRVTAGENNGRTLSYAAVIKALKKEGALTGGGLEKEVRLSVKGADASNLRIIAFVQEPQQGRVLGATMVRVNSGAASPLASH
jgi:hypothetical protein